MKGLLLLLASAIVGFAALGCGSGAATLPEDQAPPQGGPPPQSEHPPGLTDDVKGGGRSYN